MRRCGGEGVGASGRWGGVGALGEGSGPPHRRPHVGAASKQFPAADHRGEDGRDGGELRRHGRGEVGHREGGLRPRAVGLRVGVGRVGRREGEAHADRGDARGVGRGGSAQRRGCRGPARREAARRAHVDEACGHDRLADAAREVGRGREVERGEPHHDAASEIGARTRHAAGHQREVAVAPPRGRAQPIRVIRDIAGLDREQ